MPTTPTPKRKTKPRRTRPRFENIGEFLHALGDIPPERVCADPRPGTATKKDLIRLCTERGKLYELVEGTLVEKAMGSPEAFLALELAGLFRDYLKGNDLGFLYGADALIEIMPQLV